MAKLMKKIKSNIYTKLSAKEKCQTLIYTDLVCPLYGTLRDSFIFWHNLMGIMVNEEYVINPYHRCMANEVIDVRQYTIIWHANDLKLSHASDEVLVQQINMLDKELGS